MRGMAPWRDVSSRRCSSGARTSRDAGIATSWRLPVEPSMMVTVLVLGAGAVGGLSLRRAPGPAPALAPACPGRRSCAGLAPRRRPTRPPAWRGRLGGSKPVATTATGSPPSGSSTTSAQTAQASTNSPSAPAITCGDADRQPEASPLLFCVLAERGAQFIVRHGRKPSRIMSGKGRSRIVNSSFTVLDFSRNDFNGLESSLLTASSTLLQTPLERRRTCLTCLLRSLLSDDFLPNNA